MLDINVLVKLVSNEVIKNTTIMRVRMELILNRSKKFFFIKITLRNDNSIC